MSKFKILRFIGKYFSIKRVKKILRFFDYYLKGILERIDEHHIFLSGGGIAFSLLLSLVPILLLTFSILGNVISPATIQDQISRLIDTTIPYPQYAQYTKKVILSRLPEVIEYKTLAGYIGALGLFFTSTWFFSSMTTILNKIYKVKVQKSIWVGLLRDVGLVLLMILLILLSTFIFPMINLIIDLTQKLEIFRRFEVSGLASLLFSVTSVLIMFGLFYLLYYVVPYEKQNKKVVFVSAVWSTILWETARKIFGIYITDFLSTNHVYGAFVLFVVVLFWLFYSSCLLIVGAEIGQLYRERMAEKYDKKYKSYPKSNLE